MSYVPPNQDGSKVRFKSRYQNYIGGAWVPPVKERYFENPSPVTGKPFCEVPRSTAEDIDKALDAAHAARAAWGKTSLTERSNLLNKIADRMEQNLDQLEKILSYLYPAHAAFGGYKQSGIGRETHKMMLSHYQNVKNLLVSYDPKPMGFF